MDLAIDALILDVGGERWALSATILAVWLTACWFWTRPDQISGRDMAGTLIAYASQTGTAETFATLTHKGLRETGEDAALLPFHLLTSKQLSAACKLLVFASTTGVGEAPDRGRSAEKGLLSQSLKLGHLEVFVMALGDRKYEHYCAFGRRVGEWAKRSSATAHVITVDNQSAHDIAKWDNLMLANGLPTLADADTQGVADWEIIHCEEIAQGDSAPISGSRPGPLFRVELRPGAGAMPAFRVGDLFEWHASDGTRREFSIASLPTDKSLQLIVRRVELPDGAMGRASAALTAPGRNRAVRGKLRSFPNFHKTSGVGPLLAIASGSGWGGVRPHVLAALKDKRPIWVVYGERGPSVKGSLFAEMKDWQESGAIKHLTLALSREAGGQTPYVQDCIAQNNDALRDFLGKNGAIVVCGAVAMTDAVFENLGHSLGSDWLADARASNRLRVAAY